MTTATPKLETDRLDAFFGPAQALRNISLRVPANRILGIIGPSGSGKTTFLRTLNRLNDLTPGFRLTGTVKLDGADLYAPECDPVAIRKRVGMVFAMPMPLPMSIYDNLAYGPRLSGVTGRRELDELVESSLTAAFLWEEVKDRLRLSGQRLSGGQIGRAHV
jgi:phosphate transport system ATP-binding protein